MKLVIIRINNSHITTWRYDGSNFEFILNKHYSEFSYEENRYEPAGEMSNIINVAMDSFNATLKVYLKDNSIDVFVFEEYEYFKETHKLFTEFGEYYGFEVEQLLAYDDSDDELF